MVYSGTYDLPADGLIGHDFNSVPRMTLASGLSFAPGTYHLVLDGPPGRLGNNAEWRGGSGQGVAITTAAGFSVGGYRFTVAPDPFVPAATYTLDINTNSFVFELDGTIDAVPVPEPVSLALFGLAAGGLALARRRRSS